MPFKFRRCPCHFDGLSDERVREKASNIIKSTGLSPNMGMPHGGSGFDYHYKDRGGLMLIGSLLLFIAIKYADITLILVDADPNIVLALGLRPVGSAQGRLEPPLVGEGFEGGVPANLAALGGQANRAGAVVEMFLGVSPNTA
jgi:hypothetical protein